LENKFKAVVVGHKNVGKSNFISTIETEDHEELKSNKKH